MLALSSCSTSAAQKAKDFLFEKYLKNDCKTLVFIYNEHVYKIINRGWIIGAEIFFRDNYVGLIKGVTITSMSWWMENKEMDRGGWVSCYKLIANHSM